MWPSCPLDVQQGVPVTRFLAQRARRRPGSGCSEHPCLCVSACVRVCPCVCVCVCPCVCVCVSPRVCAHVHLCTSVRVHTGVCVPVVCPAADVSTCRTLGSAVQRPLGALTARDTAASGFFLSGVTSRAGAAGNTLKTYTEYEVPVWNPAAWAMTPVSPADSGDPNSTCRTGCGRSQ